MLHARKQSNDNYSYAHTKRVRATQPRNQNRQQASQSATVPGHRCTSVAISPGMADTNRLCALYHRQIHCDCSRPIWSIQSCIYHIPYYLLTLSVPSIKVHTLATVVASQQEQQDTISERCQKFCYANLLRRLIGICPITNTVLNHLKIFADASVLRTRADSDPYHYQAKVRP